MDAKFREQKCAKILYITEKTRENSEASLRKYLVSEVIDWFGSEIEFFDETQDEVSARVRVNLQAMRKWAMQYAVHTKILSPQSLAEQVKSDLREAVQQYGL